MPPRTPKNLYNPVKPSNLGEREAGLRPPSAPPHPCGPAPHRPGVALPHALPPCPLVPQPPSALTTATTSSAASPAP